jgi:hypothetical protein
MGARVQGDLIAAAARSPTGAAGNMSVLDPTGLIQLQLEGKVTTYEKKVQRMGVGGVLASGRTLMDEATIGLSGYGDLLVLICHVCRLTSLAGVAS